MEKICELECLEAIEFDDKFRQMQELVTEQKYLNLDIEEISLWMKKWWLKIRSKYNIETENITYRDGVIYKDEIMPTSILIKKKSFSKPLPQEVTDYAKSIGFELDGQNFCDFYEAKGWKIGTSQMKSWQAAVRTWKKRGGMFDAKTKTGATVTPGKYSHLG